MNPQLWRAEELIELHRPEEALSLVLAVLACDPEDPVAHTVAARALIALNRFPEAREAARTAVSFDPHSSTAMMLLAIAYSDNRQNYIPARQCAADAVRLAPDNSRAHALLAELEWLCGYPKEAIRSAEEAVRLSPDDAYAHTSLGQALYQDGRYLAAEQALRAALALDPTDATALTSLAQTLAARGRPEAAPELLQLAARADVRNEMIQQQMLRYVRGAAGGLATWPVIVLLTLLVYTTPLAAVLYGARRQRLQRFPPEVRRLLNRRSFRRRTFESGGPPGLRPIWWRMIVRMPIAVRAVLFWITFVTAGIVRLISDKHWAGSGWTAWILSGIIALYLTSLWPISRRKARQPHPFYT